MSSLPPKRQTTNGGGEAGGSTLNIRKSTQYVCPPREKAGSATNITTTHVAKLNLLEDGWSVLSVTLSAASGNTADGQAGWLATIACLTKTASLTKVGPRSMQTVFCSRSGTWKCPSVWGPRARTASSDEDAARAAGHAACSPVHEAAR